MSLAIFLLWPNERCDRVGHNVKSRGGNRLKYQIEQCVKASNKLGISKRDERRLDDTQIHSYKQLKEVLSVSQNFGRWLVTQEINDLYDLKKKHYREYLIFKEAEGSSIGHLINIETCLRLLDKGMGKVSMNKGFGKRVWIPANRLFYSSMRPKPENRSIESEKAELIYGKLSKNARIGMDLQMAFGLRLKEAAATTKAFIQDTQVGLFWEASESKDALNKAQGVTKGGRPRKVPCRPGYEEIIRTLIAEKSNEEYLIPLRYNSLKSAYYRAGLKEGSHGLRHTYARVMLDLEFEIQGIGIEGKRMMQQMIENKEAGYRKDHLLKRDQRELYKATQEVMDKVHSYLGHGSNRMDLARVYLSN